LRAEGGDQSPRQLADAEVVPIVAEVQDLPLTGLRSLQDAHHRVDELADREEASALATAIDQHQIPAHQQRVHERGKHAGNALSVHARNEVHARTDDIEGPDDGERQALMLAIRPNHAFEELFGGSIGPAFAMDGAETKGGALLVHPPRPPAIRAEGAAPVYFTGREVNQPTPALCAQPDQRDQVAVAGLDHVERPRVVQGRVAQRRE
jgi:hypothetical protein